MRSRLPAWLLGLAAAGFVLFTDDYIIAGVLPEIADEFGVTESVVGQLVTVFALTVAFSAPVFARVSQRWDRRTVLPTALTVFALSNLVIALAPAIWLVFAMRITAALAAAATLPALPAIAGKLAPSGKRGSFIATVSLGTAAAIVVGLPGGTWIGGTVGWRWTFVFLAVLGISAALFIRLSLPPTRFDEDSSSTSGIRLATRAIIVPIAVQNLVMTAMMVVLIYLAPFVAEFADAGSGLRGLLFAIAGLAGVVGLAAGGRSTDRMGSRPTLLIGVSALALIMVVLILAWSLRPIPFALMAVLAAAWGFAAFWNSPPVQVELSYRAGERANEVFAVANSVSYLGTAAAGAVGGAILATVGAGGLPVAALVCAVSALFLVVFGFRETP